MGQALFVFVEPVPLICRLEAANALFCFMVAILLIIVRAYWVDRSFLAYQ